MGITQKLILFCIGIVILPVVFVAVFYTNQLSNTMEEESVKNAVYELQQSSNNIQSSIGLAEELSNQICFNTTLNKELSVNYTNKGDSAAVYVDIIKPLLDPQLSLHRNLIANITIYIYNDSFLTDDQYIAYIDEEIMEQEWYKACTSNKMQSEIVWLYDDSADEPVYSLYRNLNSYLSESAGILKIDVNAEYLYDMSVDNEHGFWLLLEDDEMYGQSDIYKTQLYPEFAIDITDKKNGSYNHEDESGQRYRIVFSSFESRYSQYNWKTISAIPLSLLLKDVTQAKRTTLLVAILSIMLLIGIIVIYAKSFTKRIDHLAEQTGHVMKGNYDILVDVEGRDEIGQLGESFNKMLNYLDNLVNEVYEKQIRIQDFQILQKESELKALQNKINPHFLYNTLDAMRFRAIIAENEELADMMVSLSRLLRYSINNKSDIVTLDKELEHVNSYITLMKVRYEDRIIFNIDVDEGLNNCLVNKLMLQPLVENAIYHGISPLSTAGHINITAEKDGDNLLIKVEDDGLGMSQERLKEVNSFKIANNKTEKIEIGIGNVNDRIKLFFGQEYGLRVESQMGNGTTIIIKLPYKEEEGESYV